MKQMSCVFTSGKKQIQCGWFVPWKKVKDKQFLSMLDGGIKVKFLNGLETIIDNLKKGKPVMVGVMYERNYGADGKPGGTDGDNNNVATNHYITIVGMGTDEKNRYYTSYYENQVDFEVYPNISDRETNATNIKENRFYFHVEKDKNYIYDPYGRINRRHHREHYGDNLNYIITEVRPNTKK